MTKAIRIVALAVCLFYNGGIAVQAAPGPPAPASAAEPALKLPVGVVTDPEVLAAYAELARLRALEKGLVAPAERSLLPSRKLLPTDPLFPYQWHLRNTGQDVCQPFGCAVLNGTPGIDVNVVSVWDDYTGFERKVAILEWAVEVTHPDLAANYDLGLGDGPGEDDPYHGTAVTGVVAAAEGNLLGGAGVAFDATVARVGLSANPPDLPIETVAEWADVATRSGTGFTPEWKETLATLGRDGLGTVNFQSAGNGRTSNFFINHSTHRSSRHAIVVGSIDPYGNFSYYSEPGPSLLVMAPGEFVTTTVPVGTGFSGGDYAHFFGTSAATPVAAGVGAILLGANPGLGYRDVQEIFAYSARQTDDGADPSWSVNGAKSWNGGGLFTSLDYGFGLLDAHAAVRLAETWPRVATAANEAKVETTSAVFQPIPDGGSLVETITLPSVGDVDVDWVEVRLDLSHILTNVDQPGGEEIADLRIRLTSPSGTESLLLTPLTDLDPNAGVLLAADDPLPSARHRGENGAGTWTLTIDDEGVDGVTATLNHWTLTLYGDPANDDDLYVYTDSFARFSGDPGRQLLDDTAGYDILNAAAVTTSTVLDLHPGGVSSLAGTTLTLGPGTWIEEAATGDGADSIVGNDLDNILRGGRGDDTLDGEAGLDIAVFAGGREGYEVSFAGSDVYVTDVLPGSEGDEGTDELSGIEIVVFRNKALSVTTAPPSGALVDQEYDGVDGLGGLEVTGIQSVTQTFTAGLAGTLVGVEIPELKRFQCSETEDLELTIVTTDGGVPTDTLLARAVVPPAAVPRHDEPFGPVYFDLEYFNVTVEPRDVLGIRLTTASAGGCTYAWEGEFGGYSGGETFIHGTLPVGRDMAFRTFVELAADTVVFDSFANPAGALNGRPVEVGGAVWDAGAGLITRFARLTTRSTASVGGVPFDPEDHPGQPIVRISADVDPTDSSWVGVGFSASPKTAYWDDGQIWVLVRPTGSYNIHSDGTSAPLGSGDIPGSALDGFHHLEILYDTQAKEVTVLINGTAVLTSQPLSFTPDIQYAGLHVLNGTQGKSRVDNFSVRAGM